MKKLLLLLILTIISCTTTVPFTEDLRNTLEKEGVDLTKLQYYSSKKFLLNRSATNTSKDIEKGSVKLSSTVIRENIVFGKSVFKPLAGVCKGTQLNGKLGIYFENGDIDETRITFTKNIRGEYQFSTSTGVIRYDGQLYEVKSGQYAVLLISKKVRQKYVLNTRNVKGLYVN